MGSRRGRYKPDQKVPTMLEVEHVSVQLVSDDRVVNMFAYVSYNRHFLLENLQYCSKIVAQVQYYVHFEMFLARTKLS